jgi:hypothetical protein
MHICQNVSHPRAYPAKQIGVKNKFIDTIGLFIFLGKIVNIVIKPKKCKFLMCQVFYNSINILNLLSTFFWQKLIPIFATLVLFSINSKKLF